jgi:CRP-like cAMP-binding protein
VTSGTVRSFANTILRSLSPDDLAAIEPHLTRATLPTPKLLEGSKRRISTVYFLEAGIASVVAVDQTEQEMEVGLIGHEGMTGLPIVLGIDRWSHSTFMQVPGWGYGIDAETLRRCQADRPGLNAAFLKSVHSFLMQVSSTATSRVRGRVDERLARWILMAHDRVGDDVMALTHQFLAVMLGVRRAGVTVALQALADRALVETGRGTLRVLDREGLERYTRGIYGGAEQEHRRLFPDISKPGT